MPASSSSSSASLCAVAVGGSSSDNDDIKPRRASHALIRPLSIKAVLAHLKADHITVLHAVHLANRPLLPVATLLYNNNHAGCLFPFPQGSAVLIDPLDSGSTTFFGRKKSRMHAAAFSASDSLLRLAKAKVTHAFPGRTVGDRRLYRFPLKATPLQSTLSRVCMHIALGILYLFRWSCGVSSLPSSSWSPQVTVGKVQRLSSFLRRRGRISDTLVRYGTRQLRRHNTTCCSAASTAIAAGATAHLYSHIR